MQKHFVILFAITFSILFFNAASAMRITDNIYFTMPPDTIQCVDIIIPDDAGYIFQGKTDYILTASPEPSLYWGDLSFQSISTDENNTVLRPLCFMGFGKGEGQSGQPFNITISVPSVGLAKTFRGGVTISNNSGQNIDPAPINQSPRDSLNNQLNMFDMQFSKPIQYAKPNESVQFTVIFQGGSDMTLSVRAGSGADLYPKTSTVQLSQAAKTKELVFTASAGLTGQYDIEVNATISGCAGSWCTKTRKAQLIVSNTTPQAGGWSVSLFPKALDAKANIPTMLRFTITNNGPAKTFSVFTSLASGLSTDFMPQDVYVPANQDKQLTFFVTPSNATNFYEVKMSAKLDNVTKYDSAAITTDELVSDAVREATDLKANATSAARREIDSSLDSWYSNYSSATTAKEELSGYDALKKRLQATAQQGTAGQAQNITELPQENVSVAGQQKGLDTIPILIAVAAAAAIMSVAAFLLLRKKSLSETKWSKLESGRY